MLRNAVFKNFGCLRDLTVEFGPLTAIVGPNGSGKSTLLRGLGNHGAASQSPWQKDATLAMSRDVRRVDGTTQVFRRTGNVTTDNAPISYQLVRLELDRLREPVVAARLSRLEQDGSGLPNVFTGLDRDVEAQLVGDFLKVVPLYADVNDIPYGGKLWLQFTDRWNRSVKYYPTEVSDGTMLALALLALQYQDDAPETIGIEEPERGLHPYLLAEIVRVLRAMASGDIGPRPVQIVLATHSAELLELLRPEEVRFLSRDSASGDVTVTAADVESQEWQRAYVANQESLGGVWLAGGMGGVPGA